MQEPLQIRVTARYPVPVGWKKGAFLTCRACECRFEIVPVTGIWAVELALRYRAPDTEEAVRVPIFVTFCSSCGPAIEGVSLIVPAEKDADRRRIEDLIRCAAACRNVELGRFLD